MIRKVLALTGTPDRLKAVVLRNSGSGYELLGVCDTAETTTEVAQAVSQLPKADSVVAGFDSSEVIFHRMQLPRADDSQIEAMARMQLEAQLPLLAEQMSLAWRADEFGESKVSVTLAAAKRRPLEKFADSLGAIGAKKILLDAEAVVALWRGLFGGTAQRAVVIYCGDEKTIVCLTEPLQEKGGVSVLGQAVCLDFGLDDAEQFSQDIYGALEYFGKEADGCCDVPIYVLSDGSTIFDRLAGRLADCGLPAELATLRNDGLTLADGISTGQVSDYLLTIGVAIAELDSAGVELNLFGRLDHEKTDQSAEKVRFPGGRAVILAVLMGLGLLFCCYAADCMNLRNAEKISGTQSEGSLDVDSIIARQSLRQTIAGRRLDVLTLLESVNSCRSEGVLLDSVTIRRGRRISLAGCAPDNEKIYEFQERLQGQTGLKAVKIESATLDEKKKQVSFTLSFDYKNFTTKVRSGVGGVL